MTESFDDGDDIMTNPKPSFWLRDKLITLSFCGFAYTTGGTGGTGNFTDKLVSLLLRLPTGCELLLVLRKKLAIKYYNKQNTCNKFLFFVTFAPHLSGIT